MRKYHYIRPISALVLTSFFFLPLYVAAINAFKTNDEIINSPLALPLSPTLDNIIGVLFRPDGLFWYGLYNSVVLTGISITITTLLAAMCAYYLVRSGQVWGKIVMVVMLTGLMIPPAVIMMPISRIVGSLGLMSTLPGMILVNIGYYLPFAVFVYSGFIRGVPKELEEAAAIDGASRIRIFWQIVFPMLRPASASVLIFLGVWIWNDFLTPLIILGPGTGNTITVGIYRALGQYQRDFGSVFALMLLATLPVLIFYLSFQKHFIRGLTGGAIKG